MKKIVFIIMCIMTSLHCFAQTDSLGIYMLKDGIYTQMKQIHYKQIKIGIGKASNVFDGNNSDNKFIGKAKFKFYFGPVPLNKLADYYMFSDQYSIKDYGVSEFKVKKDSRLLSTVQGSIFGIKTGTVQTNKVKVNTTVLREGVYELTVEGTPGEYCIMLTRNGIGAYSGVYDFSLSEQ